MPRRVVHRYKGTINRFLGDGFMALFRASIAQLQSDHDAWHSGSASVTFAGPPLAVLWRDPEGPADRT
jgi:class 3 adenylate cyclase